VIGLSAATFALVFLRAWQQQNVIHGHYGWAIVTSYALSLADVVVVVGMVHGGLAVVPWIGTGAALGVVTAMGLHKRMRN